MPRRELRCEERRRVCAYVSSKFSNDLIVVNPDPNDDGNPADANIVGRILLALPRELKDVPVDDEVTAYAGMGGQGVLPIPLVSTAGGFRSSRSPGRTC